MSGWVTGKLAKLAARLNDEVRTVYDIGAHCGKWTALHLSTFPGAHFHLFDAVRKQGRPPTDRETWHEVCLSRPGLTSVNYYTRRNEQGSGGDSYYQEWSSRFTTLEPIYMPACTLDSLLLPPPQVMKLDTQGSEVDIMNGATKALASTLMIQIEMPVVGLNVGAPTFDDYMRCLKAHKFVPFDVEEVHTWDGSLLSHIDLIFVAKRIARSLR